MLEKVSSKSDSTSDEPVIKCKANPFDHCINKQVIRRFIGFYLTKWDQFRARHLPIKTQDLKWSKVEPALKKFLDITMEDWEAVT